MQNENSGTVSLRAALESVVSRNSGRWFRYIVGILKNEADAEDVFQEAIRRVLKRDRAFPSEEQVKMYLGRAIGNTAFELYNSRKRLRLRHTSIQESVIPYCGAACPAARMEVKELSDRRERLLGLLDKGLKQLPPKQEAALRMTILEANGKSIREVGLRHRIPYSTLRHRSKEGLRRMRKFLEKNV
jgi:RNA polymerase sigma factor (sigma-70 family)